ncbi:hypothetical protein [Aeromonas sp. MdU4]|uniref:hypothetical protein n=1 Tax=Aeromonas sp. MdU4 TaxID=3342819 RepID=UPI0035BAA229
MKELIHLISEISWPATTIWLAYIFRADIRELTARVTQLKYKDIEATFNKELTNAEVKVTAITAELNTSHISTELKQKIEELQKISYISPRAAILESWLLIEDAAGKSGFIQGADIPRINSLLFVEWLIREGKLPNDSLEVVSSLRELRNKAAHLSDFYINQSDAKRYISLAVRISTMISNSD